MRTLEYSAVRHSTGEGLCTCGRVLLTSSIRSRTDYSMFKIRIPAYNIKTVLIPCSISVDNIVEADQSASVDKHGFHPTAANESIKIARTCRPTKLQSRHQHHFIVASA